jgi:hypothetical protein
VSPLFFKDEDTEAGFMTEKGFLSDKSGGFSCKNNL